MSRTTFEIPGGEVIAPSFEAGLALIRHGGEYGEFPGIREVKKFDTPKGLFAGCCTCSWKSQGLNSEKGAWEAAHAHHAAKHARS